MNIDTLFPSFRWALATDGPDACGRLTPEERRSCSALPSHRRRDFRAAKRAAMASS